MNKTVFIFLSVICTLLYCAYISQAKVPGSLLQSDREVKTVLTADLTPGTLYSEDKPLTPCCFTDQSDNQGMTRRYDNQTYRIKRPDSNLFFRFHVHFNFIKENTILHTLSSSTAQPVERCYPDFYLYTLQRLII